MSRVLSFIIFISIVVSIYFGMHVWVYKSLTRDLVQAANHQKYLKLVFWFSGLSFIAAMILSRSWKLYFLNFYAYTWLGIMAIAFTFFLVLRPLVMLFEDHAKNLTLGAVIVIVIVSGYALFNGLRVPVVKRHTVPVKNLPVALSGFTIVQLSDLHLESWKSSRVIVEIVDWVNSLKPDLIVITGDLIDGGAGTDPLFCRELKRLKAVHGTIAVTGNHEYYTGIKMFMDLTACADFKVLRNQAVTIADGIQVVGLEDDEGHRFDKGGPDLKTAMLGLDRQKPTILLYHRPLNFPEAVMKGVDLQLSGHTHAGQIPPMDLLVNLAYRYPNGLYRLKDAFIHTSAGAGYWGPSMRFLSQPEIAHITLVSANSPD